MATKKCPVELYQNEEEFSKLVDLYKKLKPKNVLEIGSMFGGSLWYWIQLAPAGAKIVAIDKVVPKSDDRHEAQREGHEKVWPGWAKGKKVKLQVMDMDSKAAAEVVAAAFPKGIDFLFIDGDHSFNGVQRDFDTFAPMVNDGGVVALHDIAHPNSPGMEVARFWEAVKGSHYGANVEEFVASEAPEGIGVVRVGK